MISIAYFYAMIRLNLPQYAFRLKSKENKLYIFDPVRKKELLATPEEWVRQHFVQYLIQEKDYPASRIAIEKQFKLGKLTKRYDLLIFDRQGKPEVIVECKAPQVRISQDTFDQIARYNLGLQAKYLVVTNGLQHYYAQMDHVRESYIFLKELPKHAKN